MQAREVEQGKGGGTAGPTEQGQAGWVGGPTSAGAGWVIHVQPTQRVKQVCLLQLGPLTVESEAW